MDAISANTWGFLAFLTLVAAFCWYSTYLLVPKRTCPACGSAHLTDDGENCAECGAALRPMRQAGMEAQDRRV